MLELISKWYKRQFSNPQVVILALLLLVGFAVVIVMGDLLAPLLASIIIAYLLDGLVGYATERGTPRQPAVYVVFSVFLAILVFLVLGLIPVLTGQLAQFVQELPNIIARTQQQLLELPHTYPAFITEDQVKELMNGIRGELGQLGQSALSFSLASIPGAIAIMVYLILVPILVFFFLKDRELILGWARGYLPNDMALASRVWREMDQQIGNYVRGKLIEILIVGVVTYIAFAIMGLNYAMLLGALVGLSVVVPYIGAVVVTIPVALIAFFQWGWGQEFAYLLIVYFIIQALDGNVLVPLLFSEAVNLHPIAIIVAILVFGGVWGFWGVFFAIPLATLVMAVLNAWPRMQPGEKLKEE